MRISPVSPMRRRVALFLGCGILLTLLACSSEEDRLAQHVERGQDYAARGLHKEAVLEYRSALKLAPNRGDVHFGLAEAYRALGEPEAAFWELQETLRLDPENRTARIYYATTLSLSSEADVLSEALRVAQSVVADDPENHAAWVALARAQRAQGNLEDALLSAESATQLAASEMEPWRQHGDVLRRLGRMKEAEVSFRRSTEVGPGYESWVTYAQFLAGQGEREEDAVAAYRQAIATSEKGDLLRAYQGLAHFYLLQGQIEDGEKVLVDAHTAEGGGTETLRALARFYVLLGRNDEAESVLRRAATESPDDPGPHLTLAAFRMERGDLEGATAAITKAMAIDPADPEVRLREAYLTMEQGRARGDKGLFEAGSSSLNELIESGPPNLAAAYLVRARVDVARGKFKRAAASAQRAIGLGRDDGPAHLILGAALLPTDARGARAALQKVIDAEPQSVEARRLLAQAHGALGDFQQMLDVLRPAMERAPADVELRLYSADAAEALGRLAVARRLLTETPGAAEDARVQHALGRLELRSGDPSSARQALERTLALDSGSSGAVFGALLELDAREGTPLRSAERIRAAAAASPENGELAWFEGRLAGLEGDRAAAERHLRRAIELRPKLLGAYLSLARVLVGGGDLPRAVATYEEAARRNPSDATTQLMVGILYEQLGRTSDAIIRYENALALDPDHAVAKNNLAYLLVEGGGDVGRALDLARDAKAALPGEPGVADTLGWVLFKANLPDAAVVQLLEASQGYPEGDGTRPVVQHHLALAYEASGKRELAVVTARQALSFLGPEPPKDPPGWAVAMQALLERVDAS